MDKKETKVKDKNEKWFLISLVPILFVLMLGIYFTLEKLSVKSSKVCTYLGKIWISQAQATSTKPEGCYTYEQLAEIKFNEGN